MRAQVVLPTPWDPSKQEKHALKLVCFFCGVLKGSGGYVTAPTTVEKILGLYFLAETMNLSMGILPIANLPQIPVSGNDLLFLPAHKFL